MDDMAVDPIGVIKDVLEFLGLDFTSEDESKVTSWRMPRNTNIDFFFP